MKQFTLILLSIICLCAACSSGDSDSGEKRIIISIDPIPAFEDKATIEVRSGTLLPASKVIRELTYYILDQKTGYTVTLEDGETEHTLNADQLSASGNHLELTLPDGNYQIVCLALGELNFKGSNDKKTILRNTDAWLSTEITEQLPVRGEYFYGTAVINSSVANPIPLKLQRKVGRLDIDLKVEDADLKSRIQNISIRFNPEMIYTQLDASGNLSSLSGQITANVNNDLTQELYCYSFPGKESTDISGNILVTVRMNNDHLKTKEFPFQNIPVIVNSKTLIHLTLTPINNPAPAINGSITIDTQWGKDINVDVSE